VRDSQGEVLKISESEEAFFALLAQDMIDLSKEYKKPVHELHELFHQVSCNREKLVRLLEGKSNVVKWEMLEDLALKEYKANSPSYQHVLKVKGSTECEERRRYLELL
jgi:hypothetical protein